MIAGTGVTCAGELDDSSSIKWRDYEYNTIHEEFSSLQVFTI